jgi:hypothetical protein
LDLRERDPASGCDLVIPSSGLERRHFRAEFEAALAQPADSFFP